MRRLPLIVAAALAWPVMTHAAVNSTTTYATLYQVLAPVLEIANYDHLIALQRVRSREPGVDAGAIRISINAKAGPIDIPVSADGSVEFPVSAALKAENPDVETNQPKGSLALTVNAALRIPNTSSLPWTDVEYALKQAEALFAKTATGGTPKQVAGIEIDFGTATPASVTLTGKGERLFTTDADGEIIIARNMVIDPQHARLEFSRQPRHILPYVAP